MDKHLNEDEIKLQSLLEDKNFNDLSKKEQTFVLSQLSQNDYVLQRKIILASQEIYNENKMVAPPLSIANGAANSFWFKKAPVYQTLLAVAATIIFMFLITRPDGSLVEKEVVTEYVTQVDTVFETKVINDTFIQYIDKPVIVETVKYIEVSDKEAVSSNVNYASNDEVGRVLQPAMSISLPNIEVPKSSSVSNSYKNDPTSVLVSDFSLNN